MRNRKSDPKELARELASLCSLSSDELKERWRTLFKRESPSHLGRLLMTRAIGHQMQVNALGGLSPSAQRLLGQIGNGSSATADAASRRVDPGTRFLREWGGSMHEVVVVQDGVLYQGTRYRSLSEVAKAITGAHWSGPRFFGLKARGAA